MLSRRRLATTLCDASLPHSQYSNEKEQDTNNSSTVNTGEGCGTALLEEKGDKKLSRANGESEGISALTPLSVWYVQNPDRVATFETAMRTKLHYVVKPQYLWSTISELARMQSETLLQAVQAV